MDQFSFEDPTLGNKVTLVSKQGVIIHCDVIQTDTTPTRISCETRYQHITPVLNDEQLSHRINSSTVRQ